MKKQQIWRAAVFGATLAAASHASAITLYEINKVGFYDLEHTHSNGFWSNQYSYFNGAGQVAGTSNRYFGGTTGLGRSAWIHSGSVTQKIGLTGSGHTNSSNGYQDNSVTALGNGGHVIGLATRYNGSSGAGRSAWIYDGNSTQEIGLAGAEHTYVWSGNSVIQNEAYLVNDAGNVAGRAYRYNGSTSLGYSAWLYSGGTTQKIGLTTGAHTRTDGYQDNVVRKLNNAGQVIGQAARFIPSSQWQYGQSAWLHAGGTTQQIGLTGVGYTGADGYEWNDVSFLNDAGQAAGRANRYSTSGEFRGYAAWLHSGNTTQKIGLVGAEHTYENGHQENNVARMNEAGHVAGVAARYAGGGGQSAWLYRDGATKEIGLTGPGYDNSNGTRYNEVMLLNGGGQVAGRSQINGYYGGYRTWLYNGSTTQQIGLTGTGYTNISGYQLNEVVFLNESGYAAGRASRFDGSQSKGTSTWIYNGVATVEIGLTDAAHTSNGSRYSEITHLNARGEAAGRASRFVDGGGTDAWFYDPLSDVTYNMNEHLTGVTSSSISVLSDDGLALGYYYNPTVGSRAFAFSVEDGWHDLGSLVEGGLSEEGWSYLAGVYKANGADHILGYGYIGSAQALYLLTPVPEADTWALFLAGLALVGVAGRRRKKDAIEAPLCI